MRQVLLQIPVVLLKVVAQIHVITHVLPVNVLVTHAIIAAIILKVLLGKVYLLKKTVDIIKSSDISINSSVLPESLTCVYMNNCSHDVQIPGTNSLEHASSTYNAHSWLLLKGLHIVHLSIHYILPKLDDIQIVLSQNPNIDCLCVCETYLDSTVLDSQLFVPGYSV